MNMKPLLIPLKPINQLLLHDQSVTEKKNYMTKNLFATELVKTGPPEHFRSHSVYNRVLLTQGQEKPIDLTHGRWSMKDRG